MINNLKIAYFGGEPLGVPVLDELKSAGLMSSLIVCNPDRPSGRGHKLTPPPVKVWAEENDVAVWQPDNLKDREIVSEKVAGFDLFVVVAYNTIMPEWLIELPKYKTINLHPSLLPKLRGPSPIRTAILENLPEHIGVSVMLMDKAMDHGPILAQENTTVATWPIAGDTLDEILAHQGGALLADTIPKWITGEITPTEQDHTAATYTTKLDKTLGEISLDPYNLPCGDEAYQLFLKIQGLAGWPGPFFFHEGKRIKIKEAELAPKGELRLIRIIPEGKSEMDFDDYFKAKV